jgi:hypothetical protein
MGKVYARGGEPAMILSEVSKLAAAEFETGARVGSPQQLCQPESFCSIVRGGRIRLWLRVTDQRSANWDAAQNRLADMVKFC